MAVYFKRSDERKEKREIRDRYILEMIVFDVFNVVLVYTDRLTSINSITLDFDFDVSGSVACLFTVIFLEIDGNKIVMMRSYFEHLYSLRLIAPFHLNIRTRFSVFPI